MRLTRVLAAALLIALVVAACALPTEPETEETQGVVPPPEKGPGGSGVG